MPKEIHDVELFKLKALASKNISDMIKIIGDDPDRHGLQDTPSRVMRSWDKLYEGYKMKPSDVLKTFEEKDVDGMVIIDNIEFYSMCEHHMLPFFGKAHIGYISNGKTILGASKFARLLDVFARRLQVQERIGQQVVQSLMNYLHPAGAGCIIEAQHLCMMARGIEKQNSVMVTSELAGCFKQAEVRMEFLNLINRNRK